MSKPLRDTLNFFLQKSPTNWVELVRQIHPETNSKIIPVVKSILGAECSFNTSWVESGLTAHPSWDEYWENCQVTLPNGKIEAGITVAERFKNGVKESVSNVDPTNYSFEYIKEKNGWYIKDNTNVLNEWFVEAKLVLNHDDLYHLLNILVAFIPPGKTVSLQADAHRAGNCWVGLVCSYDDMAIPFIPISADIGCGMCMLPVLKDGKQLNTSNLSASELMTLQLKIGYRARSVLARGKVAESGNCFSGLLNEVMTYLASDEDSSFDTDWLDDFDYVFTTLGTKGLNGFTNKTNIDGLTERQNDILNFVSRFGMTLGSSGNHFLELNEGRDGLLYIVIHSGSRGLGAMIYESISNICSTLYGTNAVAIGKYAELYNRAYSALNKFAVMNRLMCAIAVLKDLSFEWNGTILKNYLIHENPLFSGISEYPKEITQIIRGVTHNGMKCFVDHSTQKKIFVMCKGSIAISKRASCGIVALRAGDGVAVLTMLDPNAKWVECDLRNLSLVKDYQLIHDLSETDIQLMGHGAGRSGSATQTWKNSEYSKMIEYYELHGIYGNLSPNVLGDNPEIAYKPVDEVMKYIPVDIANSFDLLRTRVNHKEGIDHRPQFKQKFAEFIATEWTNLSDEWKLMCDLVLVTRELKKHVGGDTFNSMLGEQKSIYGNL